jgi:cytochrome d ubiquinol oxidase subunit II
LRTTDEIRDRAHAAGRRIGAVAIVVNVAWVVWTLVVIGGGTVPEPTQIFGLIAVIFATVLAGTGPDGWAFAASSFGIAAAIGQIFISLYPNVMVSSTNAAYNLTVNNTAAGHYALFVMTIVAVLVLPIVLLYQGWSFHVFRRRVSAQPASFATVDSPQTAGAASTPRPAR